LINLSDIAFPCIEVWEEEEKNKIETEGSYNERVAFVWLGGQHQACERYSINFGFG